MTWVPGSLPAYQCLLLIPFRSREVHTGKWAMGMGPSPAQHTHRTRVGRRGQEQRKALCLAAYYVQL